MPLTLFTSLQNIKSTGNDLKQNTYLLYTSNIFNYCSEIEYNSFQTHF